MRIDIITLFPNMFKGPFSDSIIKRAQDEKLVEIELHNLRNWAIDDHGTIDDRPYGGGTGMVLRPEPIAAAIKHIGGGRLNPPLTTNNQQSTTILLSASGRLFNQKKAQKLSRLSHLIFICGHYEGVDQRIADYYADEELSIGDYVLTGGEIPTMVIVDSIVRLIPGVLEKEALEEESFSLTAKATIKHCKSGKKVVKTPRTVTKATTLDSSEVEGKGSDYLLEYPQYTRPRIFRGHQVPEVLLSGNHAEIAKWRYKKAMERTKKNRPNLIQ